MMASLALRWAASTSSRARSISASGTGVIVPPSFSLARPSFMATATIWACAPSCRSRSIRRSLAAESSTAWARVCSNSRTRCGNDGPSSLATSRPSRVLTPFVAHGAQSSAAAPAGTRAKETARECTDRTTSKGSGFHHISQAGTWITTPVTCRISHQIGKVR
jgi:hypothetical protein